MDQHLVGGAQDQVGVVPGGAQININDQEKQGQGLKNGVKMFFEV